jgi:hypothetical protein
MPMRILLTNHTTRPLPWPMGDAQAACRISSALVAASPWGMGATVLVHRTGRIDAELVLVDSSEEAGALGYHELSPEGTPYGIVAVQTTMDAGYDPMVTLTHEFMEVLGDPEAIAMCEVETAGPFSGIAYELCDPVEADSDGIVIGLPSGRRVTVSNFVWPSWFVKGSPGPWDERALLRGALTLRAGGYTADYDCRRGWTQSFAKDAETGEMSFRAAHTTRLPRRAARSNGGVGLMTRQSPLQIAEVAAGEPVV